MHIDIEQYDSISTSLKPRFLHITLLNNMIAVFQAHTPVVRSFYSCINAVVDLCIFTPLPFCPPPLYSVTAVCARQLLNTTITWTFEG